MRHILFLILFFISVVGLPVRESWAEFYGEFPTGLLELEKKHPYYLFVPPDYSPDKPWPLILLLGKRGDDPKEVISRWVDWAKENRFLILVPSVYPREGTVPQTVDEWLLGIKKEVSERYRIDRSRILLAGFEFGSEYAAYLSLAYPEEFSAAAFVEGRVPGAFEKLMKPTSDRTKQTSFYFALDHQGEDFSHAEKWALELEKKGYQITFDPLKDGEDFSLLRERMIQWFREDTEVRAIPKEKPRRKFKEKFRGFMEDFFEV